MSLNESGETDFSLLHGEMEKKYEIDTPENIAEVEDIAHKLLLHPQLPPYYRMRAHLILATGDTNYLFHAQQAVQICEMGIEISNDSVAGKTRPDNVEQELLDEARRILRAAEKDMKQLKIIQAKKANGEIPRSKVVNYGTDYESPQESAEHPESASQGVNKPKNMSGSQEASKNDVVVSQEDNSQK